VVEAKGEVLEGRVVALWVLVLAQVVALWVLVLAQVH